MQEVRASSANQNDVKGSRADWASETKPLQMPYRASLPSSATHGSKVYITGGLGNPASEEDSPKKFLDFFQEYDIASNSWNILPQSLGTARTGHASCVIDGRLYSMGGSNRDSVSSVEVFNIDDPAQGWKEKSSLVRQEVDNLTCGAIQDKIVVMGGYSFGQPSDEVQILDTSKDLWTSGKEIPTARNDYSSVTIGTDIYIVGGFGFNRVDKYDSITDTWTKMPPCPQDIRRHASSALDSNTFVVSGGEAISGLSAVYLSDLRASKWTKLGCELKIPRFFHRQESIDSYSFLVFGGQENASWNAKILNDVEVVDIRV